MSERTLYQTLNWIEKGLLVAHTPLYLHLFGEPLLHPRLTWLATEVKKVWPYISFSTNGTKLNKQRATAIAKVGFQYVTISPHKPMAAQWAFQLLKALGVNVVMHGGPDHNWAGQVDHEVMWQDECEFARDKKVVVHWDGDVSVCCIDDSKEGVIGTVFDRDLPDKIHKQIPLCKTCHLKRPKDDNESWRKNESTASRCAAAR